MMFLNQKGNIIYRVTLSIDKVLEPFWSLSKNLIGEVLLRERDYTAYNAEFQQGLAARLTACDDVFQKYLDVLDNPEEKKRFIEEEGNSKYDALYEEAFNVVKDAYLSKILSGDCFSKGIKKSCSLVIYHPSGECRFVYEGDSAVSYVDDFCKCLSKVKILDSFLDFLDKNIASAYAFDRNIYNSALPDQPYDDAISIASPLYLKSLLSVKAGIERCETEYKIWFNESVLDKFGYDKPQGDNVYEYKRGNRIIGLEQGQFFIPLSADWKENFDVIDSARFVWTDYKTQVFVKPVKDGEKRTPQKTQLTPEEKEFIDAAKSDNFTNLLSYLEDNLYLSKDAPVIHDAYKKYFQMLVKIENLKHLSDYRLYVPDQECDTILGVYKITRQNGEKSFNLRHMLSMKKRDENRFIKDCYDQGNKKTTAVSTLLPQYASFYIQYYYEFFVEEALKSLKQEGVVKDFLRNQKYCYNGDGGNKEIEIDALVYNGQKIFLLELKTTMHIEFLNIYPQRYAEVLLDEKMPNIYEFHLISSFADDNIGILRFEANGEYNVPRENLKSIPYKFKVAIPVKEEGGQTKDLYCLSESSFDKLKAELTRVFTA